MEKQTYSYEEAFAKSLEYFNGDELAARVWVNKYAVKDSFGNIYHQRLAAFLDRAENAGLCAESGVVRYGDMACYAYLSCEDAVLADLG